jgi:hypothetical protein
MKKTFGMTFIFFIISLSYVVPSFSEYVLLPKTRQILSYYPGDDGQLKKGVDWPQPRFQVDGDCIQDKLTGLTWARTPSSSELTWYQALEYSRNQTICGKNDWRLPNARELFTLFNYQEFYSQWHNLQGFNLGDKVSFWSSTTPPGSTGSSWVIQISANWIGDWWITSNQPKSNTWVVLPVRGGQQNLIDQNYPSNTWKTGQTASFFNGDDGDLEWGVALPSPRFQDNNDGTVTDRLTMLIWLKDASCIKSQYSTYGDYWGEVNWQKSLDFIKGINDGIYSKCGGPYTDWRLPNIIELSSLTDFSTDDLTIATINPFINIKDSDYSSYWSSTTMENRTTSAFTAGFDSGVFSDIIDIGSKSSRWSVWPVRSGLSGYLNKSLYLPIILQ